MAREGGINHTLSRWCFCLDTVRVGRGWAFAVDDMVRGVLFRASWVVLLTCRGGTIMQCPTQVEKYPRTTSV